MCFVSVYCVFRKKAQLKKKRGVPQINEQMLFHGTSSEFVEAICIHNFDWRINGIHGALFGKGNAQNSRSQLSAESPWGRTDCNSGPWEPWVIFLVSLLREDSCWISFYMLEEVSPLGRSWTGWLNAPSSPKIQNSGQFNMTFLCPTLGIKRFRHGTYSGNSLFKDSVICVLFIVCSVIIVCRLRDWHTLSLWAMEKPLLACKGWKKTLYTSPRLASALPQSFNGPRGQRTWFLHYI